MHKVLLALRTAGLKISICLKKKKLRIFWQKLENIGKVKDCSSLLVMAVCPQIMVENASNAQILHKQNDYYNYLVNNPT